MKIFIYCLLCFIWGSTWIAIKLGLDDAPPMYILSARFMLAIVILLTILKLKRESFPFSFKQFIRIGSPGLLMYTASYMSVYLAEQFISSSLTAVLVASIPFFVAIFSITLLPQEKLSIIGWLWLLIGFVGVFIITIDSFELSGSIFYGSLLAVSGALFAGAGTVVHKKYTSDISIYVALPVQMIVGVIPVIITALLVEDFSSFRWTPKSVGSVVYLATFGSVTAFLGYYWLLQRMSTVVVSMTAFVTPLVAMLIGIGLFNESFTWRSILGTILTLSGVFGLISRRRKLNRVQ